MRIALISYWKLSADGSRLISSLLKREGHTVKSIFLIRGAGYNYGHDELEHLGDVLKNIDLVMMAVYSQFAYRAIQLTEFIRKHYPGLKIIWGGPHCISAPELSLPHADAICYSEGDVVIPELIRKMENGEDYTSLKNMAFNINGKHIVNGVMPIFTDLDSLPYPDYDWEDQFLLDGKLIPMTQQLMLKNLTQYPFHRPMYWCLTARGCPNNCSYCNNCRYTAMHGNNRMRFRSVDHFLGEMEYALEKFGSCEVVGFGDDDFLIRPYKQLEEFAEKYPKRIGLPYAIAVSANTYSDKKMEILLDTGLYAGQMGVQSGSQRILDEVFNRKIPVVKTKEVLGKLEKLNKDHGIIPFVDFIIDNPYETEEDILKTYHYIVDVSPETKLNIFVLAFFPGTPIYERALKDGYIDPFDRKTFRSYRVRKILYQKNYATFLVLMLQGLHFSVLRRYIPKRFLHALGSGIMLKVASIMPRVVFRLLIFVAQVLNKYIRRSSRAKNMKKKISLSH